MTPGIDVSHYQGKINWELVAQSGVKFAFIKASQGSSMRDWYFQTNWNEARRNGIIVGAYHYLTCDPAVLQANAFRFELQNVDQTHSLPVAIDIEDLGITRTMVSQFMECLQIQNPIVYMDRSMMHSIGVLPLRLWYANYADLKPPNPVPLSDVRGSGDIVPTWYWTFWQHGWKRLLGVPTPCDCDWFNGTVEELQALCV